MNEDIRNEDGRYGRRCSSLMHDGESSSLYLTDLRKRKAISKRKYDMLLEKGVISRSSHYICKNCLEKGTQDDECVLKETEDKKNDQQVDKDKVLLHKKILEIAASIEREISIDIKSLKPRQLTSFKDIIAHDPAKWLLERPENLLHLITALCGVDFNTTTPEKITLISKIVELIYACKHSKLVLPSHFIENLLCYSYTNCKTYLNFLGERSPGGAYTFICNWLKEQSKEPIPYPDGLAKSVFDNSQKIGKTYLISGTNIVPTSVITSHLWIILDQQNNMQKTETLSPRNWMFKSLSNEQRLLLIETLSKPSAELRVTRNRFIQYCLKIVAKESENGVNIMEEDVKINVDPYMSFHQEISSLPEISCKAGEPDFVNPNSYHNVIQVIQAIGSFILFISFIGKIVVNDQFQVYVYEHIICFEVRLGYAKIIFILFLIFFFTK